MPTPTKSNAPSDSPAASAAAAPPLTTLSGPPDLYPIAHKAVRILDLVLTDAGAISAQVRTPTPAGGWSGPAPVTTTVQAGDSIEFTISVDETSFGLFAVQMSDWPRGYVPPMMFALGLLNPFAGNGQELDTDNNTQTYVTREVICKFKGDGKLSCALYRSKKDQNGTPMRDPNPISACAWDVKATRDDPIPGKTHIVLRLPHGSKGTIKVTKGSIGGKTEFA